MIVITGATGNVGRPLVQALAAAGEVVTAVSRRRAEVPAGVRHVEADLSRPETLEPAVEGAEAVFLLTGPEFLAGGNLNDVIKTIRAAGVERTVLLSSQGVGTKRHPSDHEDAVTRSGLAWTILRPGNFNSNALQWAAAVRAQRAVEAPFADVALPAIDPTDIAEAAAVVLTDPAHASNTYTLTGPAPISPRQQAHEIALAINEPVRFVELTRTQARDRMTRHMPAPVADATLDVLGSPSTEEQQVSPDVEKVLGRPARTFAEWAGRNVGAFR
ncbi:NAD-dependent epimerase/dehydratase family protein [Kribbella pittospori]|uniref:NAD-dependent epimerase/dehydratase family protein n=1 Tax=Kribbella pittospori TaxID=722689 RepID=A0A4R0KSQ6_9ACTN|nr:NAD(P)H-binding protein [Kribbella pittospori]TCC61258.1 NAD-dependent epimerase/dehydratase family protein [Kribbella pittospori]